MFGYTITEEGGLLRAMAHTWERPEPPVCHADSFKYVHVSMIQACGSFNMQYKMQKMFLKKASKCLVFITLNGPKGTTTS